jgi:hypothetical protein
MTIKIIDNFLEKQYFNELEDTILGPMFPWFFQKGIVSPYDGYSQFIHLFYTDYEPKTKYFGLIFPIFEILGASSVVRSKANLLIKTDNIIQHDFHSDHPDCTTAILYLNTNNGKTIFEDGTEVESIANRLIVFNSNQKHTGTTCTDEYNRVVINFNYHV